MQQGSCGAPFALRFSTLDVADKSHEDLAFLPLNSEQPVVRTILRIRTTRRSDSGAFRIRHWRWQGKHFSGMAVIRQL